MSKVHWGRMTWKEIKEAQTRNPVVIIPIGTVETHGPHNIIGLETVIVERLGEDVARRTNSLVIPAIPFGDSDQFLGVPGTISVRPSVLEGLYEDTLRSVIKHGFDHLLVLGAHVPNQPILGRVFRKLRDEEGILVVSLNPGRIAPNYIPELFDRPADARGHGAEPGLSLAEYLCPGDVYRDGAEQIPPRTEFRGLKTVGMTPKFQDLDVLMAVNVEDIAPEHGGWGDPTQGSAEHGRAMYERMVDSIVAFAEQFATMDTRI